MNRALPSRTRKSDQPFGTECDPDFFRLASDANSPVFPALAISLFLVLFFGLCLDRSEAHAQTSAAPAADAAVQGNAQNGKQVFATQGCYKCHGSDAQGMSQADRKDAGPRIGPPRLGLPAFLRFVRNPTGAMLPFSPQDVSDAALTDVYAFLQSLAQAPAAALAPGNPQDGQRFFHDYGCYECHGGQGQGATQTGGSRIGPPQIDFSSFLSYVRQPTNQMPPYTSKAVPESQMADIYAYLKSIPLPPPSKSIPLLNQ